MGIAQLLTAPQSPRQNGCGERLIGSIRPECLNHFIILNSRHLKKTLASYFRYDYRSRPKTVSGILQALPVHMSEY
jgi:putative transposase